jgi:hypothetical protein
MTMAMCVSTAAASPCSTAGSAKIPSTSPHAPAPPNSIFSSRRWAA